MYHCLNVSVVENRYSDDLYCQILGKMKLTVGKTAAKNTWGKRGSVASFLLHYPSTGKSSIIISLRNNSWLNWVLQQKTFKGVLGCQSDLDASTWACKLIAFGPDHMSATDFRCCCLKVQFSGFIGSYLSQVAAKRYKPYPCDGFSNSTRHLVFAQFLTCLRQCQNHCSEVWGPELIVLVLFYPDYLKQSDKTLRNGNMTFIILQNEGFYVLAYFWQNAVRI